MLGSVPLTRDVPVLPLPPFLVSKPAPSVQKRSSPESRPADLQVSGQCTGSVGLQVAQSSTYISPEGQTQNRAVAAGEMGSK